MKIFINLLPPAKKKDLQNSMVLAYAQTMIFVFFLTTILVSGTLFSLRIVLQQEHDYLTDQITIAKSSESTDVMTNIREINTYLLATDALQKRYIPWAKVISNIGPLVPPNARLNRFRTDAANHIFLSGIAATREENLMLQKALQQQPYLSDVQSPLSNILKRTNVEFSYEMRYQPPKQPVSADASGL